MRLPPEQGADNKDSSHMVDATSETSPASPGGLLWRSAYRQAVERSATRRVRYNTNCWALMRRNVSADQIASRLPPAKTVHHRCHERSNDPFSQVGMTPVPWKGNMQEDIFVSETTICAGSLESNVFVATCLQAFQLD